MNVKALAKGQLDGPLALQGIGAETWVEPMVAELARQTNDKVRAISDSELEAGLSPSDFIVLLAAAARQAEADADH